MRLPHPGDEGACRGGRVLTVGVLTREEEARTRRPRELVVVGACHVASEYELVRS